MLSEQVRQARRIAKEIMDQEWIAAGKTREQLDREEQIDALFDALIASGYPEEKLLAEWQNKTAEEVLREYALPEVAIKGENARPAVPQAA